MNAGDVVRLKDGGPAMTVEIVVESWVVCVWDDGVEAYTDAFLANDLMLDGAS